MRRTPFGWARTRGFRGVLGVFFGFLLACGGSVASLQPDASNEDATGHSGRPDAAADEARAESDADVPESDAEIPEADSDVPESDADAGASCADLENAAQAGLASLVQENLGCQVDSDCTSIFLGPSGGLCAACSVLTNEAGAATVLDAAASLCRQFNAQGCPPPIVGCPRAPPVLCAGGTCASYVFYPTPLSPSLTHGECATFQVHYRSYGGSPDAPHDLAVTLRAFNGTLYSDTQCAMPMADGGVTIPAGSTAATFSLEPAAAGICSIIVQDLVWSWTAE
jgi:hypothetical protein